MSCMIASPRKEIRETYPPPLAGGGWGRGTLHWRSPLPQPPPARGGGEVFIYAYLPICAVYTSTGFGSTILAAMMEIS